MRAKNVTTIFKVQFPECLIDGNDIYYTVYNADGTINISRTNTGIVDFNDGDYGVELNFDTEGNYLIKWDIDTTSYKTSEEFTIYPYTNSDDVQYLIDLQAGRWVIDENTFQMIFYKEDNTTEVARFDLKDIVGNPAYINVFERVRV